MIFRATQSAPRGLLGISALLLILLLAGSGCSRLNHEPAVLWTDNEEFAAYAELFNTSQTEYKVSVAYRENPGRALRQAEIPPDIVIGSFLNHRSTIGLFQSLEPMIEKELLDPNLFYPGILRLGAFEEKLTLLPVSFTLPVMMFPDGYEEIDGFALSLERLRELSSPFSGSDDSRTVMGFSPRWNQEAAYTFLRLFNTNFAETQGGTLIWNQEALQEGIDYLRGWVEEVNGGWEVDSEFIAKYLYEPTYKLVAAQRILFAFSRIDDYFRIPADKREQIDFRWLSHEEQIPMGEDIILAGIPRSAKRSAAARAFLSWFFRPEVQTTLLETSQYKRMRLFGIAGGFSSLQSVNEIELPRFFPELIGHIPPAGFLELPTPLPDIWADLKAEAILPWIGDQLNETPRDQSLQRSIERWMNQQPQH